MSELVSLVKNFLELPMAGPFLRFPFLVHALPTARTLSSSSLWAHSAPCFASTFKFFG